MSDSLKRETDEMKWLLW